jgi:hypothetical protein
MTPQMSPDAISYALLTDGSTVAIRPGRPEDAGAVREMHEQTRTGYAPPTSG